MSKKGGLEVKKNLDNISYEEFVDIVKVPSKVPNLLSGKRSKKLGVAIRNTSHWCNECDIIYPYTEYDRKLLLTALKQAEKKHFVLTLTSHGKQILNCNKTEVEISVGVGWCQHNKDKFYKQYFNKDVTVNYDRNKFICLHCLIRTGTLVQSRGSCGTTGIKAFETLQPIYVNGELNTMFINSHKELKSYANKRDGGWQYNNTWYNDSDRWVARGDHLTNIVPKAPTVVDKEVRSKQLEDKKKMAADIRKKARAEESRKQKLFNHAAIKLQAFVRGRLKRKAFVRGRSMKTTATKIQAFVRGRLTRKAFVRGQLTRERLLKTTATKIQALVRGRLTRNNIMLMKTTATKIQALVRGCLIRKTLQFIECDNGDKYIGSVHNDLPNGRGKYIYFKKGGNYIGNFKNGKFHGYGKYSSTKNKYYGFWEDGSRHGNGTLILSDGHCIKGEWDGDTVTGTLKYPDGTKKFGKWIVGPQPTKQETKKKAKKKKKARKKARKKAAIKIQAIVRGRLTHNNIMLMKTTVTKIQALVRGYLARKKNKIHATFTLPRLGCTINDDEGLDNEVEELFTGKDSAFGIVGSSIDLKKGLGLKTATPIQPVVPYLLDILVAKVGDDNIELAKLLLRDVSIDLFHYKGIDFNDYMSRHVLDVVKQIIVEHNGDLVASYVAFEKNCHGDEIPKFRRQLFFNCVASYVKQEKAVEVQCMNQMLLK